MSKQQNTTNKSNREIGNKFIDPSPGLLTGASLVSCR